MINISKLAAILEDEGLIKTAVKKGGVYTFKPGAHYTPWHPKSGPLPTKRRAWRWFQLAKADTPIKPTPRVTPDGEWDVEYLGPFKWTSKLKAMMLDDFMSPEGMKEGNIQPEGEDSPTNVAARIEQGTRGLVT